MLYWILIRGEQKLMSAVNALIGNQMLVSAVVAWFIAQALKNIIDFSINRSFDPERIFGSGGMPSSHSAMVCALAASCAMRYGLGGFEFAVSFVLAGVVMYDAAGVRRETGKQAKAINSIFSGNLLNIDGEVIQETLKEAVGHTPLQVFVGALLGIGIAFVIGEFY